MSWRIYGEPEQEKSPMANFFLGLFPGTICIYDGGTWGLVSGEW